ncbi:response regulator [Sulfurimonas sp. SAG-AH-194-C21]|nr:ATP-binding protein [Sulfurimonas sp. SAG-AH-194-C21]MDF1882342.1 response regulator [Sulfurimonas sp. SAG-AH-194-C21]
MLLLLTNSIVYILTEKNIQNIANDEIQEDIDALTTHYQLLLSVQKNIAFAIHKNILRSSDVSTLLDTSLSPKIQKQNRAKLYMQVLRDYNDAKTQGVLQIQFVDKNNISFLRMHKVDKFGDDLTGIRKDFEYTNRTKKQLGVFSQGRTSHGFRNIFPVYKGSEHIGSMEISFSSDDVIKYLNNTRKLHASFLINKKLIENKTFKKNDLVVKYVQSVENRGFVLAETLSEKEKRPCAHKILNDTSVKKAILFKMAAGKAFSSYSGDGKHIIIYSFLPVKNINKEAVAWFVSYTNSETIQSILFTSKLIRIFSLLISLLIFYFILKQIKSESKINELSLDLLRQVELFTSNVMAWECDLDGKISYITQSLLVMSGYTKKELLGVSFARLHTNETNNIVNIQIKETLSSGNIWKGDCQYKFREVGSYWVRCSIYPKLNEENKLAGYQAILHSIDAEKSKEQFLANMSHEIRTPLNAIMGFIKLLKEEHENLNYLDIIDNSSKSLLQIINDILDFSKIESGKLDIDYHDFNPVNEFNATRDLFSSKCSEKSIQLHVTFENMPEALVGDPLRIKQVINNLLSNAIKFTAENKNIYLNLKYEDKALCISVIDEGIGISQEYQKTIFESFTQADISTTRKYGGTGLGLSISSSLVNLMGGKLNVKSKLGEGSEFYFSLPLQIGKSVSTPKIVNKHVDFSHLKILLVEDNKSNQLFMRVIFKKVNIKFDIANDGLEAIEMFKSSKYNLVFMDENMPNMNGIKATQEILRYEKEQNLQHTPIVALTANAFRGDREKFLDAGMDGYLTKPLDKNIFISTVQDFTAKKS